MTDRYQSGFGAPGTMPTEQWWRALMEGVDAPLGHVVDVGAAEGVMCLLAARSGADSVLGIGLHDDRMDAARSLVGGQERIEIREQCAEDFAEPADTVVFSMMAHWLGQEETRRFASLARRYFLVVFRERNEHYAIPENGTWFPTLDEMDRTVDGIRTHEAVVLEQDRGKRVWAVTYRTDMRIVDGQVVKRGRKEPLRRGRDLHGDPPFRPTHGADLVALTESERKGVRDLIRKLARASLESGTYPSDLSPRNIIVNRNGAWLVDDEPDERMPGTVVAPEYLPIWQRTLSVLGIDFDGDLRGLL